MKRLPPSRAERRGTRRPRVVTAVALLWLAFNTVPTVLALVSLGNLAGTGSEAGQATGEDRWLEPRHLGHDDEPCSRSRDCVFSSPGSQSLLGLPAAHVVGCLGARDGVCRVRSTTATGPWTTGVEPHQPRAPPIPC